MSCAFARRVEAGEDLHQRRFAGAVVADDAQDLAGIHMEVHIAQRRDGAEIFVMPLASSSGIASAVPLLRFLPLTRHDRFRNRIFC